MNSVHMFRPYIPNINYNIIPYTQADASSVVTAVHVFKLNFRMHLLFHKLFT